MYVRGASQGTTGIGGPVHNPTHISSPPIIEREAKLLVLGSHPLPAKRTDSAGLLNLATLYTLLTIGLIEVLTLAPESLWLIQLSLGVTTASSLASTPTSFLRTSLVGESRLAELSGPDRARSHVPWTRPTHAPSFLTSARGEALLLDRSGKMRLLDLPLLACLPQRRRQGAGLLSGFASARRLYASIRT